MQRRDVEVSLSYHIIVVTLEGLQSLLCVIGVYFNWLAAMKFKIINVSLDMKIFCTGTVPWSAYKTKPQCNSTFPSAALTGVNVITALQIAKQQQSVSHFLCTVCGRRIAHTACHYLARRSLSTPETADDLTSHLVSMEYTSFCISSQACDSAL